MKELTDDARRRLQAIETFADLGSGFNIAMQDLDIRGAGNMLGAEQSGFIADLGYETYQKILNEAMTELREEEFAELFVDEPRQTTFVSECQIESDLNLMFPSDYILNVSERMTLYRELDNLNDEKSLHDFEARLIDRFGPVPAPAKDLMVLLRIRWRALQLGIERIVLKNGRMTLYLVGKDTSPYYQSSAFTALLTYIGAHPHACRLGEKDGKRFATFSSVNYASEAYAIFEDITPQN